MTQFTLERVYDLNPVDYMQVHIRQATVDDAAEICQVVRTSIAQCCALDHHNDPERISRWLANKTIANFEYWIDQKGAIALLALHAEQAVGTTLITGDELSLCYATPEVLHQGIGKQLLIHTEASAVGQGITRLRLDTTKTALPFYLRHGFSPVGTARSWAGLETQPMLKELANSPSLQQIAATNSDMQRVAHACKLGPDTL